MTMTTDSGELTGPLESVTAFLGALMALALAASVGASGVAGHDLGADPRSVPRPRPDRRRAADFRAHHQARRHHG